MRAGAEGGKGKRTVMSFYYNSKYIKLNIIYKQRLSQLKKEVLIEYRLMNSATLFALLPHRRLLMRKGELS